MTGKEYAAARRSLGWSQDELAAELGVSRRTIVRVETSEHVPPIYDRAMAALSNNPAAQRDVVTA